MIINKAKREAPVETGAVIPKLTAYEKIFIVLIPVMLNAICHMKDNCKPALNPCYDAC